MTDCTGASDCPAETHLHGCFAERLKAASDVLPREEVEELCARALFALAYDDEAIRAVMRDGLLLLASHEGLRGRNRALTNALHSIQSALTAHVTGGQGVSDTLGDIEDIVRAALASGAALR